MVEGRVATGGAVVDVVEATGEAAKEGEGENQFRSQTFGHNWYIVA